MQIYEVLRELEIISLTPKPLSKGDGEIE